MADGRVLVLGASGITGRLVTGALVHRGVPVVAAGPSDERLVHRLGPLADRVDRVVVDVTEPTSVIAAVGGVDVVVTTVGPFDALGRVVVDAAIDAGVAYVDTAGEAPFLAWVRDHRERAAAAAGVPVVVGAGAGALPGDLLAALAAEGLGAAGEVHVAYAFPRGLWRGASAGTRRSLASLVGAPVLAAVAGRLEEERVGETRRLAWFPRPVGPRHAAAVPGLEPLSVPRHLPDATVVRTYLSMSTPGSELLQFAGNLARWQPAARRLRARVGRPPRRGGPDDRHRATQRWACVAEVGSATGVGRAWAYGTDPYRLTAASVAAVVERVLGGDVPAGVVPPALVDAPADLLDRLAATTDLRWGRAVSDRRLRG